MNEPIVENLAHLPLDVADKVVAMTTRRDSLYIITERGAVYVIKDRYGSY